MGAAAAAVEVDYVGERVGGGCSGGTDNVVALRQEEALP